MENQTIGQTSEQSGRQRSTQRYPDGLGGCYSGGDVFNETDDRCDDGSEGEKQKDAGYVEHVQLFVASGRSLREVRTNTMTAPPPAAHNHNHCLLLTAIIKISSSSW